MHEYGITARIIGSALRAAEQNNATVVARVDLRIGELTFLDPRQVKLAYEVLTKGTLLEGSRLCIEQSKGLVECSDCGVTREVGMRFSDDPREFPDFMPLLCCPQCKERMSIRSGKECLVKGIAFEV